MCHDTKLLLKKNILNGPRPRSLGGQGAIGGDRLITENIGLRRAPGILLGIILLILLIRSLVLVVHRVLEKLLVHPAHPALRPVVVHPKGLEELPANLRVLDGGVEDKPLGGGVNKVRLAPDVCQSLAEAVDKDGRVLIVGEAHLGPVVVHGPDLLVVRAELAVDFLKLEEGQARAVHAHDDSEGDVGDGGADGLQAQVVGVAPGTEHGGVVGLVRSDGGDEVVVV